jgi:hypothetical protein
MDTFSYLAVLFSIVLGLALTQILQGFSELMLARTRVVIYWPALIWAAIVLLIVIQSWWAMFAMRTVREWTFAMYANVLVQTIFTYMIARLALPDSGDLDKIDMRESYFSHRRWFFALLALAVISSLVKDPMFGDRTSPENAAFHGIFLTTAVIAAITKSRWYHALAAPVAMTVFIIYIVLLFARL